MQCTKVKAVMDVKRIEDFEEKKNILKQKYKERLGREIQV